MKKKKEQDQIWKTKWRLRQSVVSKYFTEIVRKGCLLLTGKAAREVKRLLRFLYFRNIKQSDYLWKHWAPWLTYRLHSKNLKRTIWSNHLDWSLRKSWLGSAHWSPDFSALVFCILKTGPLEYSFTLFELSLNLTDLHYSFESASKSREPWKVRGATWTEFT